MVFIKNYWQEENIRDSIYYTFIINGIRLGNISPPCPDTDANWYAWWLTQTEADTVYSGFACKECNSLNDAKKTVEDNLEWLLNLSKVIYDDNF